MDKEKEKKEELVSLALPPEAKAIEVGPAGVRPIEPGPSGHDISVPTHKPRRHEGHVPIRLDSVQEALRFANLLVKSKFLPATLDTPAKALAVIITGQELGIPPMKALRMIYIIDGRPHLKAELILALFKERGGRAHEVELTEDRAVWWFRHPNGDEHTETFTLKDAKIAGLLFKDNWKKNPKIMMRWRAIANGSRVVAPDMFGGVYDPDELDDSRPAELATDARVVALRDRMSSAEGSPDRDCELCGEPIDSDNKAEDGLCMDCAQASAEPS